LSFCSVIELATVDEGGERWSERRWDIFDVIFKMGFESASLSLGGYSLAQLLISNMKAPQSSTYQRRKEAKLALHHMSWKRQQIVRLHHKNTNARLESPKRSFCRREMFDVLLTG
jgi:hypothetical protein